MRNVFDFNVNGVRKVTLFPAESLGYEQAAKHLQVDDNICIFCENYSSVSQPLNTIGDPKEYLSSLLKRFNIPFKENSTWKDMLRLLSEHNELPIAFIIDDVENSPNMYQVEIDLGLRGNSMLAGFAISPQPNDLYSTLIHNTNFRIQWVQNVRNIWCIAEVLEDGEEKPVQICLGFNNAKQRFSFYVSEEISKV